MKKTALAILVALGVASTAQARPKIFAQIDLGYGGTSWSDIYDNGSVFLWRPTIGLELGQNYNHIVGIDYTQWYDDEVGYTIPVASSVYDINRKMKIYTIGLKYAYRFNLNNSKFKPYVGARLNISNAKETITESISDSKHPALNRSASGNRSVTRVGFGAMGGFEYPIIDNFYLGANAEVNYIASDVISYGITAFAKYSF